MRIALPIDGTPAAHRAVRHVVRRAKRGASLEVELVALEWPIVPEAFVALLPAVRPTGSAAAARVRDAWALFGMHGIPFRVHRAAGDPARAIARVAHEYQCDEIVMGRLGSSQPVQRLLRSLPERVARIACRRVTVVD